MTTSTNPAPSVNRSRTVLLGDRPRLLCDVDEVLCDFQSPSLRVMSHILRRTLTPEDFKEWDIFGILTPEQRDLVFATVERPGFCSRLDPLPGAVEAIKNIQEFAEVIPVTYQFPSPTWVLERTEWLGRWFGFKANEIVFTGAKHAVVGDALLDDKPDNVRKWMHYHPEGLGMLWHIPNTRLLPHDDIRVKSWDEVISKLKAHVSL